MRELAGQLCPNSGSDYYIGEVVLKKNILDTSLNIRKAEAETGKMPPEFQGLGVNISLHVVFV